MKNKILIIGLLICLHSGFSLNLESGAKILKVSSISNNSPVYRSHRFNSFNKPFSRKKYGTLTGFSPSIRSNYPDIPVNQPYFSPPPPPKKNTLQTRIKRFFNPNYNNHYLNSPYYNPYLNGNYNSLNNSRYIPLYNNQGGMNGYNMRNGFSLDTIKTNSSGATVTIID